MYEDIKDDILYVIRVCDYNKNTLVQQRSVAKCVITAVWQTGVCTKCTMPKQLLLVIYHLKQSRTTISFSFCNKYHINLKFLMCSTVKFNSNAFEYDEDNKWSDTEYTGIQLI